MPPVEEKSLAASLLERLGQTEAAERVVVALRYLAPATGDRRSGLGDVPLTARRRCKAPLKR